jgi:tRNA(Ile)-lysidine synthase
MLLLPEKLVERVRKIITRYSMFAPGERVGVAVSGGADSVVLLRVLHELVSDFALHLTVLHVNHELRGSESDADETFVAGMANALGLRFVSTRAKPEPGNLEQEARRIRRHWFSVWRRELTLDKVALGHTRSDQAETVLYRFLRGSGTSGLAGMRPLTVDHLVRPLLCASRAEVRAWASAQGVVWRDDLSNADERFARNLLRNKIMPELSSQFNRNLDGILAGQAQVAADEEDYWREQVTPIYRSLSSPFELGILIATAQLTSQHNAVQRRVLRQAIADVKGDLRAVDLQHVEAVLEICRSTHGHDRVIIPGVDAVRSFGMLLLAKPGELNSGPRNYSVEVTWNERITLPFGGGEIEFKLLSSGHIDCVKVKKESQFLNEIADLDAEVLLNPAVRLQVRNWRPGDGLLRPGHRYPEKIKALFQESQVLLWQRRHWPVAVANDEIFWVRQFGAASPYLAKSGSAKVARLSYLPKDHFGVA